MSEEGGVAAVDRALTILDAFTIDDHSLTLTEISKRVGFYKSTTLRLTESLERFGYLHRLPDGAYRLGSKPLFLGLQYQKHFKSSDIVPPVLRKIVEDLQEGASFFVRDNERRVCLHRADSARAIRDSIHEGESLPIDVGASGHILLAFSGQSGERYDKIRSQLYAISIGERDPETAAIACPVFSVGQKIAGALSVSGPRYRFEDETVNKMIPVLKKYGAELSSAFGGIWPQS
jgi:DNA-binding IclR family transcriptional regulator